MNNKIIPLLVGIILGISLLAGSQYVLARTNERAFCASCHGMVSVAVTHKVSTHANLACNDCHLPHDSAVNYILTKAKLGATDVYLSHFGDTQLPIMTTISMKEIVNDNCIRCHTQTNTNVAVMNAKENCVDCHRNVPHASKKPIDTRIVRYE